MLRPGPKDAFSDYNLANTDGLLLMDMTSKARSGNRGNPASLHALRWEV